MFPLSAAWWTGLKPLLLAIVRSALASRRSSIMISFFLVMASWIGVSASLSCKLLWAPSRNRTLTTSAWVLLTPICRAVWRRLFLAFKSHLTVWPVERSSITLGSSPNAAWWIALSPSLSSISKSTLCLISSLIMFMWPFWEAYQFWKINLLEFEWFIQNLSYK